MAVICIAGAAPGIGKTAVAELLLPEFRGWHVARVRVADEIGQGEAALLNDQGFALLPAARNTAADAETARLQDAGQTSDAELARLHTTGVPGVSVLLAEPRGLDAGIHALLAALPRGANLVVEGNAYLWARDADVAVMVLGAGPSGKGLVRVRQSVREIFQKIHIWAWNTRRDPDSEGFYEFPQAMARMGFRQTVSNRADFHPVNPPVANYHGNPPFLRSVQEALERSRWRAGSDEFLRKAGFDV